MTLGKVFGFATTDRSKKDTTGTQRKTSVEANRKTFVGAHRKTSVGAKKRPSVGAVGAKKRPSVGAVGAKKRPTVGAQRKPSAPEDEPPSLGWFGGAVEGTSADEREQLGTAERKESQKTSPSATGILTDKELVNNYKNVKLCQRNIHVPFYWFYSYSVNYTFPDDNLHLFIDGYIYLNIYIYIYIYIY